MTQRDTIKISSETRLEIDRLITDAGYFSRVLGAHGILPDAIAALVIMGNRRPKEFAAALRSIRMEVGMIPVQQPAQPPAAQKAARGKRKDKAQ